MPESVQLIPLQCFKCQTPVPASADEVAWVCSNCGQGLQLSENKGTAPLEVKFAEGIAPGQNGRPFWVTRGRVTLNRRTIFGGGDQTAQARAFWQEPHWFYIPAFACTLDQVIDLGTRMLLQPPSLSAGSPAPFLPVVAEPADVAAYAEFVVMGIEAARKDKLREVLFDLQLETPELWVIP